MRGQAGPNPWWVLAGLTLGVLVTSGFARFAQGLILPAMRAELGWTCAQAGWLNTSTALNYLAGAVATMVPSRRIGAATLFAAGLLATAPVLAGIAAGSALPLVWPGLAGMLGSALVFGACVLMARGAVTTFARGNLPAQAWGLGVALCTAVVAAAQTVGPWAAGLIGDAAGGIGAGLAAAAAVRAAGAGAALAQRRLSGG